MLIRTILSVFFPIISGFIANPAVARVTLTGVYVFGEAQTPLDSSCGLSRSSVNAAVESVIRGNKIPILDLNFSHEQIRAYVSFTPIRTGNACSVSYSVQFGLIGHQPYASKRVIGLLELCQNGGVMNDIPINLQSRLNESFRSATETCISESEKSEN